MMHPQGFLVHNLIVSKDISPPCFKTPSSPLSLVAARVIKQQPPNPVQKEQDESPTQLIKVESTFYDFDRLVHEIDELSNQALELEGAGIEAPSQSPTLNDNNDVNHDHLLGEINHLLEQALDLTNSLPIISKSAEADNPQVALPMKPFGSSDDEKKKAVPTLISILRQTVTEMSVTNVSICLLLLWLGNIWMQKNEITPLWFTSV